MQREIFEYIKYLSSFKEMNRPKMPNFDLSAYTDNEYQKVINEINQDFDVVDDFDVYLRFLKGE